MCCLSDSIAAAIKSVAFQVRLIRSEISKPSLFRRSWINLITSRTLPAAINAGVSSRSSATLSPSCEETLHPLFGISVMTRSAPVPQAIFNMRQALRVTWLHNGACRTRWARCNMKSGRKDISAMVCRSVRPCQMKQRARLTLKSGNWSRADISARRTF